MANLLSGSWPRPCPIRIKVPLQSQLHNVRVQISLFLVQCVGYELTLDPLQLCYPHRSARGTDILAPNWLCSGYQTVCSMGHTELNSDQHLCVSAWALHTLDVLQHWSDLLCCSQCTGVLDAGDAEGTQRSDCRCLVCHISYILVSEIVAMSIHQCSINLEIKFKRALL